MLLIAQQLNWNSAAASEAIRNAGSSNCTTVELKSKTITEELPDVGLLIAQQLNWNSIPAAQVNSDWNF